MWTKICHQSVGGLREVGFINNTDNILVLGGGGRTIFNCLTGEKIARDRFDYYHHKWDMQTGIVEGFDFCEGEEFICGGFEYRDQLIKESNQGWQIEIKKENRLDYNKESKVAEVMSLTKTSINKIEVEVYHYGITRSYGFSPTGKTFVTAESYGINIWRYDD